MSWVWGGNLGRPKRQSPQNDNMTRIHEKFKRLTERFLRQGYKYYELPLGDSGWDLYVWARTKEQAKGLFRQYLRRQAKGAYEGLHIDVNQTHEVDAIAHGNYNSVPLHVSEEH